MTIRKIVDWLLGQAGRLSEFGYHRDQLLVEPDSWRIRKDRRTSQIIAFPPGLHGNRQSDGHRDDVDRRETGSGSQTALPALPCPRRKAPSRISGQS